MGIPVAILAGLSFQYLRESNRFSQSRLKLFFYITVILSIIFPIYQFGILSAGDSISNQYHQTMLWIQNNTPSNSTFLTQWSDGSAIEAWGQRQSFTDSVMGEHFYNIKNFSDFMFAKSGNFTYLNTVKPNYLITRGYWIYLVNSILSEGYLLSNTPVNNSNFRLLVYTKPNMTRGNVNVTLIKIYSQYNTTIYKVD